MLTLTSSALQPTLLEMFFHYVAAWKKGASREEKICDWVVTDVLSVGGGLYVLEVNNRD